MLQNGTIDSLVNTNINLTCHTNDAYPTPVFTWFMSKDTEGSVKQAINGSTEWLDNDDPVTRMISTVTLKVTKEHHLQYIWCCVQQEQTDLTLRSDVTRINVQCMSVILSYEICYLYPLAG